MLDLVRQGLKTGIVTTCYPFAREAPPSGYFGQIALEAERLPVEQARAAAAVCPTAAIEALDDGRVRLDRGRCILCGRCAAHSPEMFAPSAAFETAALHREDLITLAPSRSSTLRGRGHPPRPLLPSPRPSVSLFRRSLHIRHIDTGDDNATVSEVKLLDSPAYDLHRLGFFFVTSPRHADALLVTGVMTRGMERPLRETYEAMPQPRLVIAAGTEAISGAPFDAHPAVLGGVDAVLPVDVFIPGSPPAPLALLYGLLLAVRHPRLARQKRGSGTR